MDRKRHKWTDEEDQFILDNYNNMTLFELSESLNIYFSKVHNRIKTLGIKPKQKQNNKEWDPDELKFIEDNIQSMNTKEIAQRLNRVRATVVKKAKSMGLSLPRIRNSNWSEEDINLLTVNFLSMELNQLSSLLGRTPIAIRMKAAEIGLKRDTKTDTFSKKNDMPKIGFIKRPWSSADMVYLMENYKEKPIKEVCERLGRSIDSVRCEAIKLGLGKKRRVNWTKAEILYIQENSGILPHEIMAEQLGKSIKSVANKLMQIRMSDKYNNEDIKTALENDVPYPITKSAEYRQLLAVMEIGQSFVFPEEDRPIMNNQRMLFQNKTFLSKKIDDKTRRIWRIS